MRALTPTTAFFKFGSFRLLAFSKHVKLFGGLGYRLGCMEEFFEMIFKNYQRGGEKVFGLCSEVCYFIYFFFSIKNVFFSTKKGEN